MSERPYRVDYIEEETYLLFEAQGAKLGFPSFEAYLEHLVLRENARPDTPENRAAHAGMRVCLKKPRKERDLPKSRLGKGRILAEHGAQRHLASAECCGLGGPRSVLQARSVMECGATRR